MSIKLSGLSSNLDTDSIVQALVSAYSVNKTNLVKAQTKLSWKQTAWKDMNTKIYSFYTGKLSSLRLGANYSLKTASITDSTVAKVTASSGAVNGNQKLLVKQLASSGYLTGGKITGKTTAADGTVTNKVTGSSKLSDITGMGDAANGGMIDVKVGDGASQQIAITSDMTVNQFVVALKDAGVGANFDEANQRFFVNSKVSGLEGDFSLTASNSKGNAALQAMGLMSVTTGDIDNYRNIASEDYTATAKAEYDATVESYNEQIKSLAEANEEIASKNKLIGYQKEYATAFNDALDYSDTSVDYPTLASREAATNQLQSTIANLKEVTKELEDRKANAGDAWSEDDQALLDDYNTKLKAANDVAATVLPDTVMLNRKEGTPSDVDNLVNGLTKQFADNEKAIADNNTAAADMTTAMGTDFETSPLGADITAKFQTRKEEAQAMVDAYDLIQDYENGNVSGASAEAYAAAQSLLGVRGDSTAVRVAGQDSIIELNGAEFTSNTNNYSINGLNIQALSVNTEAVSITTDSDVDGIYNMIKDFFKDYNTLLTDISKTYNATSASGYEPLSDDEKEGMTDSQIEAWEKKVKDALLRKDSTLSSISSLMSTDMMKSIEINGKDYNLSSFGIKTLGYFTAADNEKGNYHIDGNKDDTAVSGNTDKLREAIANDPETVVSFFTQLTTGLYKDLTDKMKSTTMRSIYNVYNDKQMSKEYSEYTTKIATQEEKIKTMEDFYNSKFTAMEKALSQLNSQTSALSNLMGS